MCNYRIAPLRTRARMRAAAPPACSLVKRQHGPLSFACSVLDRRRPSTATKTGQPAGAPHMIVVCPLHACHGCCSRQVTGPPLQLAAGGPAGSPQRRRSRRVRRRRHNNSLPCCTSSTHVDPTLCSCCSCCCAVRLRVPPLPLPLLLEQGIRRRLARRNCSAGIQAHCLAVAGRHAAGKRAGFL